MINERARRVSPKFKHNVHTSTPEEIVGYAMECINRRRGAMALFIRQDGWVRVIRDELLEDASGRGVVMHVSRHHTQEHVLEKLRLWLDANQAYLRPTTEK